MAAIAASIVEAAHQTGPPPQRSQMYVLITHFHDDMWEA